MMSQAFYYLHILTTAQSAYHRSHNKFSRYFRFKVIYNMLFYRNMSFCPTDLKYLFQALEQYKLMNIIQKLVCFFVFKKTCQYHV